MSPKPDSPLRVALAKLRLQVHGLSWRERAILFAAGLIATVLLWNEVILQAVAQRKANASASLAALGEASLNGQQPAFTAVTELSDLVRQLEASNAQWGQQLVTRATAFVEPAQMPRLLRELLAARADLHLISLITAEPESLTVPVPTQITDDAAAANETAAQALPETVYLHDMDLAVEGNFQQLQGYIEAVEAQHWHVLWRGLTLETTEYPLLRAHLKLATLSVDRHWTRL
jgi:MSHA biogenesis protein MshJ